MKVMEMRNRFDKWFYILFIIIVFNGIYAGNAEKTNDRLMGMLYIFIILSASIGVFFICNISKKNRH